MKDLTTVIAKQTAAGAAATVTSRASYASSGLTMIAGINVEAWGVIAGIFVALCTLVANIYFQRKRHKLDIMLAQAQLQKTAEAAVDKTQQEILQKMIEDFKVEFGDHNKRKGNDRRQYDDPNYKGPERRKGPRRQSISNGDSEDAKTLKDLMETAQAMAKKLEELEAHQKDR